MTKIKQMWTEKYRSRTFSEYIFQNEEHKVILEKIMPFDDIIDLRQ